MKQLIRNILGKFDIVIQQKSALSDSVSTNKWKHDIEFTLEFGREIGSDFMRLMELSKSQIRQDLFVLNELKLKRDGFFVEFGATDGVTFSNSYLLEKEFGYSGILAEPNPRQRKAILIIRDAIVEDKCVWSESGKRLEFVDGGDLSTIKEFSDLDMHSNWREGKPTFFVDTISLTDMLIKHNAPSLIDYLSIDTEGSEFEVLSAHDFSKYKFSIITVEHNYTEQREQIFELLTSKGYKRKYENLSIQDDWYVLS